MSFLSSLFFCCGNEHSVLEDSLYTNWNDLDLAQDELGHGQYGSVHMAKNRVTGGRFAVKVCHKEHMGSKEEERAHAEEILTLRRWQRAREVRKAALG